MHDDMMWLRSKSEPPWATINAGITDCLTDGNAIDDLHRTMRCEYSISINDKKKPASYCLAHM